MYRLYKNAYSPDINRHLSTQPRLIHTNEIHSQTSAIARISQTYQPIRISISLILAIVDDLDDTIIITRRYILLCSYFLVGHFLSFFNSKKGHLFMNILCIPFFDTFELHVYKYFVSTHTVKREHGEVKSFQTLWTVWIFTNRSWFDGLH